MKRIIKVCLFTALFLSLQTVSAQDAETVFSAEESSQENSDSEILESEEFAAEDFDSLFETSEDTDAIIVKTEDESKSEYKRGIVLTGNLSTRLGGYIFYYPFDIAPGATFETTLSFASRPTNFFSIHGALLAKFPQMEMSLYELYINYALWDVAYIMAGKKAISWGNGRIFDTNIIDDVNDNEDEHNPEKLLYDKEIEPDKSKFTVQLSVPIKMINIVGLVDYKNYDNSDKELKYDTLKAVHDLSCAAMVEANLNNLSFDVFWKMWADNDPGYYDPVVGVNANFQLGDFHFYGQYYTHVNTKIEGISFPRMKATGSVWWATREKVNLGFILEYQMIYDYYDYSSDKLPDSSEYFKNYIAFEGVWARINGSPFTVALKYFHDFHEGYGTIVPGLKWHDILPDADLDIGLPIYYGTQQKYGVAIQLKLNVDF